MISTTSAVIMASGFSKRMGRNKLFLPYDDQNFLQHTVTRALAAGFLEVIVVIRPEDAKKCQFAREVKVVLNHQSELGQSSSVRLGTAVATGEAILFLPVDQPLLTVKGLQRIAKYSGEHVIVVPITKNQAKGPVCFGADFFAELLQVSGEKGGYTVRQRHKDKWFRLEFPDDQLADIDFPETYAQFFSKKY